MEPKMPESSSTDIPRPILSTHTSCSIRMPELPIEHQEITYPRAELQDLVRMAKLPALFEQEDSSTIKETDSVAASRAQVARFQADTRISNACKAGLWLLVDELDASHEISQSLSDEVGSWWHAIMHRRERDFWNSKYWYRKTLSHPAYASIHHTIANSEFSDRGFVGKPGRFDPLAFVDACEEIASQGKSAKPTDVAFLQHVAWLEWIGLFSHCVQSA